MPDTLYCYPPDYKVLKNKLGITSQEQLDLIERMHARNRIEQGCCPTGDFDLKHLQAIHGHIFQDVYEWAGQIREVEIAKTDQFMFRHYIPTGMNDVHKRIVKAGYFKGTNRDAFAVQAGEIIGDVNYVHPFREGNGRTQLQYLKQLATRAEHQIDLSRLDPDAWIEASKISHEGDYRMMGECIRNALI